MPPKGKDINTRSKNKDPILVKCQDTKCASVHGVKEQCPYKVVGGGAGGDDNNKDSGKQPQLQQEEKGASSAAPSSDIATAAGNSASTSQMTDDHGQSSDTKRTRFV